MMLSPSLLRCTRVHDDHHTQHVHEIRVLIVFIHTTHVIRIVHMTPTSEITTLVV